MMKKGLIAAGIAVGIFVFGAFAIGGTYNKFVDKEETVEKSWSQVETQLQRRMDLIPNLVKTVEGYMEHEQGVMKDIANARASMMSAKSPEDLAEADGKLTNALGRLLVVTENYPDLKANTNFTQLMDELAGTENRIAVARKDYNDDVSVYNKDIKKFPAAMFAGMLGFDEREYFKAAEGAENAPTIDFGADKND